MIKEFAWDDKELKVVWQKLYRNNKCLTPYSSWEYNDIVYRYKKLKPQTLFQKNYFYVYYENTRPMILFPFSKKRGDLILFGENISGAEYLDFVYDENITDAQMIQALKELKEYHHGTKLKLYKINERAKTYRCLHDNLDILVNDFFIEEGMDRICKKISFPDDYEDYFQQLTKNSKSNMKKAYNKFKNNGVKMELKVFNGPIDDRKLLRDIFKVNTKRSEEWMHKHRASNFAKYIKNRYFSVTAWSMQKLEEHRTFCFFLDGKLAAFMTGYLTNYNEITFPMISMDSEYAKLSPGKVMISEVVKYLQNNTDIRVLDVSRGDERYKTEMGGHSHFNYRFSLML